MKRFNIVFMELLAVCILFVTVGCSSHTDYEAAVVRDNYLASAKYMVTPSSNGGIGGAYMTDNYSIDNGVLTIWDYVYCDDFYGAVKLVKDKPIILNSGYQITVRSK